MTFSDEHRDKKPLGCFMDRDHRGGSQQAFCRRPDGNAQTRFDRRLR
jgi:hypothetical protein